VAPAEEAARDDVDGRRRRTVLKSPTFEHTLPSRLIWLLVGAATLAPFWYWSGGLIEIEALQFVQQYLDGRGLLQKIFDPYANDLGTYQARELSYLLDYLDARVFEWLMTRDLAVFVPASSVAAAIASVAIFAVGVRRTTRLPSLSAALLLLAFITNYVYLVTMGMLYRSAKPMLAPVLMAATFYVVFLVQGAPRDSNRTHGGRSAPMVVFGLFSAMSLLDRQGFFYAIVGLAVLAFYAVAGRGRRDVAAAAAAAVAAMSLYNVVFAPLLIRYVNG
jgi:hypothetical protein